MDIFVIVSLLLLSSGAHSAGELKRSIVLQRSICHKNDKYVDKCMTPTKRINRTTSLTSVDINLRPDVALQSPLFITFIANKKFNVEYRPYMVNLKYDLCDMFKYRNNPLFKLAFEMTNKSASNMFDPCPLKGHRFIDPYYTSYDSVPMMPGVAGLWRWDVIVTVESDKKSDEVLKLQDFYEVTEQ